MDDNEVIDGVGARLRDFRTARNLTLAERSPRRADDRNIGSVRRAGGYREMSAAPDWLDGWRHPRSP